MDEIIQNFIKKCQSEDFYMYINNEFFVSFYLFEHFNSRQLFFIFLISKNLKDFSRDLANSETITSDCNSQKNRYKDILPCILVN